MSFKLNGLTIMMVLLLALAVPMDLAAQQHHHYKLFDLGTLGGPDSVIFGLTGPLNNRGMVSSCADTSVLDPNFPNINPYFAAVGDSYIQHAFVWQDGVMTDLGTLPGGTSSCEQWISDTGVIVGGSTNGSFDPQLGAPQVHATMWLGRKAFDLGTMGGDESIAFAVNNFGQVAGGASNQVLDPNASIFTPNTVTQVHAVFWNNGIARDLGTLGTGLDSMGYNVNDIGQVAGMSFTNNTVNDTTGLPTVDIFLWENGKMFDLGTLGGVFSMVNYLNNRGQVAGYSDLLGDNFTHPIIGDRNGMKDLGTLGGDNGVANWLNDAGQVVGNADLLGDAFHHAFLWQDGIMTDLGTVDADGCSNAVVINSLGQAVGNSTDCNGHVLHTFLWENAIMLDLGALIVPGSSIVLKDPNLYINDRSEIVGQGLLPNGDTHAVVLIPCDENHPGIEGCDYSLVESTATANVRPTQTTQKAFFSGDGNKVSQEGNPEYKQRFANRHRVFSGTAAQ